MAHEEVVRVAQAILAAGAIAAGASLRRRRGGLTHRLPSPASSVARFLPAPRRCSTRFDRGAGPSTQLGLPETGALRLRGCPARRRSTEPGRLTRRRTWRSPDLTLSVVQTLEPDPIAEAFDGTAITGRRTTNAVSRVQSSLRTTQPFEELADALAQEAMSATARCSPTRCLGSADVFRRRWSRECSCSSSAAPPQPIAAAEHPAAPRSWSTCSRPLDQPIPGIRRGGGLPDRVPAAGRT